ncbi:hypothetical protein LL962_17785 [Xanthomonas sp. NCPPB 1067]|uniref:hypothetical protein n=1 Tax=Xanthomonas TaxID=338 RepID=UPI001E2AEDF8|nr:hypothetical protein [Xanthomonas sp. NCPPB 1067]MCC4588929.1 hypothetical protein [Xanthomonas sp. NCPPB 1067]
MATSKSRKKAVSAAEMVSQTDQFAFGVTIEQIDQFHALLRTIAAQSDMVAVCGRTALDAASVPVLGEGIFTAARALRRIVDEIHEQRLSR